MALACDFLIGSTRARFKDTHTTFGLVPCWGLSQKLSRLLGIYRAKELSLTGNFLDARTAADWGLVNRVVPDADLRATAIELAKELANGPASLGAIRTLIWESLDTDWTGQLQAERKAQKIAGKSEDFIEGVSAFLQKRVAAFKGR